MQLCDVNVLVYAFRRDANGHARYRDWLEAAINGAEAYGFAEIILSGFLRVVTNPRVFPKASPLETALTFCEQIRGQENAVMIAPGGRHWDIFRRLCRDSGAKGNLIADAYLAALAIESGCEWITTDRDYARFPGLRWQPPEV